MAESKETGADGVRHVMEEEMREKGVGVFEERSSETRRRRAKASTAPTTKDAGAAPENKAISASTVPTRKARK